MLIGTDLVVDDTLPGLSIEPIRVSRKETDIMIDTVSDVGGLLQTGRLARQRGQLIEARKCLGAALAEARRNNDRYQQVEALLELARLSESGFDIQAGRQAAQECLDLCVTLSLRAEAGSASLSLGKLALAQGNVDEALACWSKALDLFELAGSPSGQLETLIWMGGACFDKQNFQQAQAYLERGLKLSKGLDEYSAQGIILLRLGQTAHLAQADWQSAKALFEQAAALLEQYGPVHEARVARQNAEAVRQQLELIAVGKMVKFASALAVSGEETMVIEAVDMDGKPIDHAFTIVIDENDINVNVSFNRPGNFTFSIRPAEARWQDLPKNVFCLQHKSKASFWHRLKQLFRPD